MIVVILSASSPPTDITEQKRLQCVICTIVIRNDALKSTNLERPPNLSNHPPEYVAIREFEENETRNK